MAYVGDKKVLFNAQINGLVNIDNEMSADSENPVQNKTIANNVANALKGNATGNIIAINDVSPIEHGLNLFVGGKNLLNPNATLEKSGSYLGVKLSKEMFPYALSVALKDGATIPSGVSFGIVYFAVNDTAAKAIWLIGNGTILKDKTTTGAVLQNVSLENLSEVVLAVFPATQENWDAVFNAFNVQLEYGSAATDYEEYIDLTNTTVNVCGKNLFDIKNSQGFYSTYGGITSEIVEDSIIVTCTVASRGGYLELGTFPAGTYYISTSEKLSVQKNGASIGSTPCKITLTENTKLNLYKGFSSESSPVTISNIQVEYGETQTDYETPNVTAYTPNADGTIDGVVSKSPNMTVFTDTDGVTIDCEYNKDTNKVIENLVNAIISLGGNV